MSSGRFQSSFTGAPTCFEIHAASAMKSFRSRRPKPPPMRVMLTVTRSRGCPGSPPPASAGPGILRRRPEHDFAVLEMRGAVLRFEIDVGKERIGIGRLHDMRRPSSATATSPSRRRYDAGACCGDGRASRKARAALGGGRALVPGISSFSRAWFAAHQFFATMATPSLTPCGLPLGLASLARR